MLRAIHHSAIQCASVSGLLLLILSEVFAQAIHVNGGSVTMRISAGSAGGQLRNVVSATSTLAYQKKNAPTKITVRTVCLGQQFTLEVAAINVTNGAAAPAVALLNGSPAIDFIRDIQKSGPQNATCVLQYTASATFAQGNSTESSDDVHTVTYTIQSQ